MSLRAALKLDPGRADAAVQLASMLHGRSQDHEALEILGNIHRSFAADGLAARISFGAKVDHSSSRPPALGSLQLPSDPESLGPAVGRVVGASSSFSSERTPGSSTTLQPHRAQG